MRTYQQGNMLVSPRLSAGSVWAVFAVMLCAGAAFALDPIPTNTLVLRLRPESLSALADGAAVATWPDSSGHGRDGVATLAAWQPVFKTSILAGLGVVRFAGGDDRLDTGLPSFTGEFTAFAVVGNVGSGIHQPILGTHSAVQYGAVYGRVAGEFRIQDDASLSFTSGQVDLGTAFQFRSFERSAANDIFPYVNGSADPSGNLSAAFNLSIVGARLGNEAQIFFTGDIAEILVYSNRLSATDRQLVEGSLAWKYGLQDSLPVAHPYKIINPNNDAPELGIADATVVEGDDGTTSLAFNVTLTAITSSVVTVEFGTSNGTALAGSDYVATNGTLTFTSAGTTAVQVRVVGDTTLELDETLFVSLSNATCAAIVDSQAQGTIIDNDPFSPVGSRIPSNNLALWLRPDLLSGLSNGEAIALWRDATVPREDAVQALPGQRPTCQTNVVNGYRAARFVSSSHETLGTGIAAFPSGGPFTAFVIVGNVGSGGAILGQDDTGFYGTLYGDPGLAAGGFRIQDDNNYFVSGLTPLTAAFQMRDFDRDTGNTVREYVNGSNVFASASGVFSGAFHMNTIGGRPSLAPVYFDGDIPELLIYSNLLSASDRQLVEGLLAWKYGLQDNLPADHPWKTRDPNAPPCGTLIQMR